MPAMSAALNNEDSSIASRWPGQLAAVDLGHAIKDLAASFQASVVTALVRTLEKLALVHGPKTLIVAGGVACNLSLRAAAEEAGQGIDNLRR